MATLDQYQGILPYASELFGVYQPLLGWKANQPRQRVDKERQNWTTRLFEAMLNDTRFRQALADGPKVEGPGSKLPPRSPAWMKTAVATQVQSGVQKFIQQDGSQPTKHEWDSILREANVSATLQSLAPAQASDATQVEALGLVLYPKSRFSSAELKAIGAYPVEGTDLVVARRSDLQSNVSLLRESLVAGMLTYLVQQAPQVLPSLFLESRRPWEVSRNFIDPLANFDPTTQLAVLSPIGMIHLYREYFFELRSFLGSPVGHVWVSPGGTVELFEIHTQRRVLEREIEQTLEVTQKSELTTTDQEELSDAVKQENQTSTSLGVTASGGGSWGVYHADASVNYQFQRNQTDAQETAHKYMRQQTEKLSNEVRRGVKTVFRTTVDIQDTSSRRYVLQNTTDRLVNYELRRKMRQVAVQVQYLGTQLCWQVYIDNPGQELGIAELVHIAKPEDVASGIQPPEAPPVLPSQQTKVTVDFAYEADGTDSDTDEEYKDGDDGEGNRIIWQRDYTAIPPGQGYTLTGINPTSVEQVDPNNDAPSPVGADFNPIAPNKFRITLHDVNFNDQPAIRFGLELFWNPPDQTAAQAAYQQKLAEYQEEQRREAHAQYIEAIRERIKLASNITLRPADDLREEERIVVYRRLIRQLTQAGFNQSPHVTTELIRSLFDVDKMLYFVASEWWQPRPHYRQQVAPVPSGGGSSGGGGFAGAGSGLEPATNLQVAEAVSRSPGGFQFPTGSVFVGPPDQSIHLTEEDTVGWGGIGEKGRDNYLITEESKPAPMGASLGWLLQLDGDSHRNAFLNSPWVKAVIPIHLGREDDALTWLKLNHVEGTDGLDALADSDGNGKTIEEALHDLATQVSQMNPDNIQNALATETVFEDGFDPLEGGFRAPDRADRVFDQWTEVLPTDQIVAVEYTPGV